MNREMLWFTKILRLHGFMVGKNLSIVMNSIFCNQRFI